MPGVLVLVEQHHPKARTLGVPHLGVVRCDTCRKRHLTAEVEGALPPERLRQAVHQRKKFHPPMLCVENVEQFLTRPASLAWSCRQCVNKLVEFGVRLPKILGFDEVLCQLSGKRQHGLGDRRRIPVGVEVAVPRTDHAMSELPQFRFRQQGGRRFDGQ